MTFHLTHRVMDSAERGVPEAEFRGQVFIRKLELRKQKPEPCRGIAGAELTR